MGTDRDEIEVGPCPCGKGVIRIDHCSPDHPWGGGAWLEASLDCAPCSKHFSIETKPDKTVRLVRKSDVKARRALLDDWHEKGRQVEASAEFRTVKSAFESALSVCRSGAAKHRLLKAAGLTDKSLQTYYKHPGYRLSSSNVLGAAAALQIKSSDLDKMAADLERSWNASQVEMPAVKTGLKYLEK